MKNRDKLFMDIARRFAAESTCERLHVGAVIVVDRRIVATGYNGVPSGMMHCNEWVLKRAHGYGFSTVAELREFLGDEDFKKLHAEYSKFEIHAEQNALSFAANHGISVRGSTLYTTHSPCLSCANSIIAAGVERVVYDVFYDRENAIHHLTSAHVGCFKFKETFEENREKS